MKRKHCYACNKTLSVRAFYRNKGKKDGLSSECRKCGKRPAPSGQRRAKYLEYQRTYNKENRDKRIAQSRSWYAKHGKQRALQRRLAKLGIDLPTYQSLRKQQKDRCAICQKKFSDKLKGKPRALHIDHCHKTGKVRGLLCATCNRGLGSFYDKQELLQQAIAYLSNHGPD